MVTYYQLLFPEELYRELLGTDDFITKRMELLKARSKETDQAGLS